MTSSKYLIPVNISFEITPVLKDGFLKYKTLLFVSSLICSLIKGIWG